VRNAKDEENAEPERASPEAQTPFDRFSEFARKVVAVPKKEADEQERRYRKSRTAKRKRNS
jgi:hypothetical protein